MESAVESDKITAGAAQMIFDVLCDIYCRTRPVKQKIVVLDKNESEEN